jgi:Disulphide bond corrector protein DsbC.
VIKDGSLPKLKLVLAVIVLSISLSCTRQKTETNTPAPSPGVSQARNSVDVVKASSPETEIARNQTGDALVQLNIEKGYHVNANPPTFPYLKATELTLAQSPGVSVSFIVYPNPLTKSFPFAEKPLAVYEGATTIKVKLKVEKAAHPGKQNLSGKLLVQACDDQVCYAPGTLDVSIPLSIK